MSELNLKGFIVTLNLPSDSAMRIKCDTSMLKGVKYLSFINELKAFMNSVDFDYAERQESLRGRELEAHYQSKRIRSETGFKIVDSKTLWVRPFPSRFENILKTIRVEAYRLLNGMTICITRERKGMYKDNIYLLPGGEKTVNELYSGIKRLNEKLNDLSMMMAKYEKGEELEKLMRILRKNGVKITSSYSKKLEISVDLLPIDIDVALEEWASKNPEVANTLQKAKKEMVEAAVQKFKAEIEPLLRMIEGEARLRNAKETLEKLKALANTLGMSALARTVLLPLEKAVEDPENTSKYIPSPESFRKDIDVRLKGVLENL